MLRFISYGKGISIFSIVFIHIFLAYFNANDLWAYVVNAPVIENRSYPKLIELINDSFYVKLFGFIVAGSVCFFFLSSGFTFFKSKEKRNFLSFWENKLKRLLPFYYVVLFINALVVLISAKIFDIDLHHNATDFLWQFLIGLQYFFPHGVVLDLVVWFLGVLLFFYFIASIVFKKFSYIEFIVFDFTCIFIIVVSRFMISNNIEVLTLDNYMFIIKSTCFSLLIVCALVLSLYHYSKISKNSMIWLLFAQVLLFLISYRVNANYVNYIHLDDYFVWFVFYIILFLYLSSINKNIKQVKFLDTLDKISFSLYLSHGIIGYFTLSCLLKYGVNKTVSCFITLVFVILFSYFLNKYVEQKINNFIR